MIRVATYNVHGFVGLDQRRDPARTAAVITELQCDAVGLQEVDSRYCSSAIDTIERHTGMRAVPGVTMSTPSGDYGNVLLSRVAVRGVRRHDLTVDNREPRGALEAELEADGGAAFRMIVTHLGLRRSEGDGRPLRCSASSTGAPPASRWCWPPTSMSGGRDRKTWPGSGASSARLQRSAASPRRCPRWRSTVSGCGHRGRCRTSGSTERPWRDARRTTFPWWPPWI